MEVSALKPTVVPGLRGPTALLRLQSDERLITLIRRGHHAAFEVLFSRYRARLLAFCRHMLGSREDAEDVLQEVFAAAFNAILADEREINVRPWLYRIARNRSLNHLRRASAIGVDSMDVHFAENGVSTAEKVMRRESFRQLIGDVQQLPETQRTALLLREIDALSYEQIAQTMETTVPAVKSLLVRARISLAEAAEARKLTCEEVRLELGEVAEGLVKISPPVRRHVRDCERCRTFRKQLKDNNVALAAMLPVGPLLLLKKLALTKLGSTAGAGAGGAHVAGGAGAAAGAGAAGGATATGSLLTAGTSALATKAVAGLAVAAIVTAGTVEADHSTGQSHHHHAAVAAANSRGSAAAVSEPVVTASSSQPITAVLTTHAAAVHPRKRKTHALARAKVAIPKTPSAPTPPDAAPAAVSDPTASKPAVTKPAPPITQVTTETTQLPSTTQTTGSAPPPAAEGTTPRSTEPTTGDPTPGEAPPPTQTTTTSSSPTPPSEGTEAPAPESGATNTTTLEHTAAGSPEPTSQGSADQPIGDGAPKGAPESR